MAAANRYSKLNAMAGLRQIKQFNPISYNSSSNGKMMH
ncbi:hypothetical protein TcasGA2_TC033930 [Tribolium castaneum]|uniref:Uncharacterized protein n=1 Tax=Tribolium castaneum TaxID=7070 RepID=A0A139WDU7_TRICA|nr:hypothetical protein TcasGA2_TC033930 [Tribolium castaneum]